jgi:hypothetical protein
MTPEHLKKYCKLMGRDHVAEHIGKSISSLRYYLSGDYAMPEDITKGLNRAVLAYKKMLDNLKNNS